MNELLVAVFDNEAAAANGMRTVEGCHQEGAVSVYASALIVRDGQISVKQQQNAKAPLGTALGLLLGGIAGIPAGPAGSAAAASLGGYMGLLADCARSGVDLKFVDDVGKTLTAGKAAVLAEIEESWASVLEPRLREQGGVVFRRFRTDVAEDQLLQESKALQQQLEFLEEDLARADAQNKKALEKRIQDVQHQLEKAGDRAKAVIDQRKAETDLKVNTLVDQAATATQDAKARIKSRIADAKADLEVRSKKLNQAWALAKEAIAPDRS